MKTFAMVYVNLELLVNDKLNAYGTGQDFRIVKIPWGKVCYFIRKLESTIARVYLPQYFSFIIWLNEDMKALKNKCPIRKMFFLLFMGH